MIETSQKKMESHRAPPRKGSLEPDLAWVSSKMGQVKADVAEIAHPSPSPAPDHRDGYPQRPPVSAGIASSCV